VARTRVIKSGRTLIITQGDVFAVKDGIEKICATMQQTLIVMRGVPDVKRV
jgi:microcompartment protein CcmL/EutN